jgi:hypothetical protein
MSTEQSIWVWVIKRPDVPGAIFGALRRCERAHWSDDSARAEVNGHAAEMQIGPVRWEEVDDRTWVGRTDLAYVVVVTSVLLPPGQP